MSSSSDLFSIQEQVEEMKKKEERMEKHMNEIQAENRRLKEPLEKAREEVAELTRQLANYEKDKASLAVSCIAIRDVRVQILIWMQTFLLFTKPHFQTF